ncbi:MAG TPA: RNA methyltransferase [Bacteroidia bacterium]|nr:RNA methyltransferase [Bacteroidia bacterium]
MLSKKQIQELRALHLKKFRDITSQFLVEGIKSVLETIEHRPSDVIRVYATETFFKSHALQTKYPAIESIVLNQEELEKISLQPSPNQVIALCRYFQAPLQDFDFSKHFSLYLDEVRDPGNFGTILRLADWFGISKVFCSPSSCELYNPKVIQASMGAFLRVDLVVIGLQELVKLNAIERVYGAVLNGESLYSERIRNGLLVIGNEARGISEENLRLITHPLTIPSAPQSKTESLNAAMATAIFCSEFYRQTGI